MKKTDQTSGLHPNVVRSQIIKNAVINRIDYFWRWSLSITGRIDSGKNL